MSPDVEKSPKIDPSLKTEINSIGTPLEPNLLAKTHAKLIAELSILNEISQLLCRNLELDDLLKAIEVQISRVFDTSNLGIGLYKEGSDEWTLVYATFYGEPDPEMGKCFKLDSGLSGFIIRNHVPILFHNQQERDAFFVRYGLHTIGKCSQSWIGVPLISANKIVGVMSILDYEKENVYDEQDLLLFSTIASQVASTIDRKLAEEASKTSVARYRYLLDTMPNGYYLSSHEGHFVDANQSFIKILGYDNLDDLKLVYIPTALYVSEPERERLFQNSEFTDQTEIYRLKRKDGRIIWIEDHARYIKNSEGTVLYHQGICKDITDRKHAEEINAVLFEISNSANTTPNLEDLYASIHKILGRVIDLTNFYISLYDRQEDVLTFVYWVDTIDHPPKNFQIDNISSPQTQSHCAEVIMTGKPVLHSKEQFMEILRQRGVQPRFSISETWLGVPLKIKGEVIGAMAAHSFVNPNFYSQRDMDLFIAVSEQVAVAIERKRAEDRLQKSESRFRRLIQDIPGIAIQGYRLDGTTTYWNQASERLYGYTEQEAVGRNLLELIIPPEMQREVAASMEQMTLTGQAISSAELFLMKKDGSRVAVYSNRALVNLPDTPTDLFCLDIDITARITAEADKARLLLCQRAILDNLPMMAWLKDTEGHLEMINQPYAQACDRTIDECIGKTVLDLFPEEMAKAFMADDREVIDSGRKKHVEERISSPDGDKWHLTYKTPIYDEHGLVVGTTGIAQDISERKRAEEEREGLQMQLNQAQKMEAIGQLAGGVAHDFNNMLGVIVGYSEMILEEGGPSQEFHAELEEIQKAARRSADLTRQLLAFARKQTVALKVLDLNQTVEAMLNMLRRLIGENIHLAWMPGNSLWPIKMDPSQIDQILANLCVNARDAIAGVGTITVATENYSFSEEHCTTHVRSIPGEYVRISISDTGNGMDKETLSHIFEPFFTSKGVGEGTGLGLASVYGAVKQNNGFINVVSEPGQGTSFAIHLPRYLGNTQQGSTELAMEPVAHGHETILLVEDESTILGMTVKMLERLGYTVLSASSPEEAMRLVAEFSGEVHMLVTDVVMPGMNGRDLADRLMQDYPTMKCLFMSGYTANIITNQGVLSEERNFIKKPFSMQELAAKVRQVLESMDRELI